MNEAYLLLGSNLGNRKAYLKKATNLLKQQGRILKCSSIYETEPWGFEANSYFLNQAVLLETKLTPRKLLSYIHHAEKLLGRRRNAPLFESRVIDIDILFYNDEVIKEQDLIIPHPEIQNRLFSLLPLGEIANDLIHPVFNKTINQLEKNCKDSSKLYKFE